MTVLRCLVLLVCLACRGERAPSTEVAPLLTQAQLTDAAVVVQAMARATPAHQRRAGEFDAQAQIALAGKRYDAAAKAFGEASLYAPSASRMLGCAAATARGPRPRPTEDEARAARQQAIDHAAALLAVARALADGDRAVQEAVALELACLAKLVDLPADDPCASPRLP